MGYTVVLERESDGGFVAYVPALPGCVSQGDDRAEALENVREAIELYLEDCRAARGETMKEIAKADSVPVYTIFTNGQLAKMVQMRALSKSGLEKIAGVGAFEYPRGMRNGERRERRRTMDIPTVLSIVETWPVEDRVSLARELWNRLRDQVGELELDEELKAELERRMREDEENPDDGFPWDVVMAEALARARR